MSEQVLPSQIFDTSKSYKTTYGSVFLESNPGLLDSINRRLPKVWELYKLLKKQDWDEEEQDYRQCRPEFLNDEQGDAETMLLTIAWQWETDSLAAHHLVPLMAPFVSSSEYWATLGRIGDNETIHALTYSEIVRQSVENSDVVMGEILARLEPLKRMSSVANVMMEVMRVGAMLNLNQMDRNDPVARDTAMMFLITLFAMERVQFMISFAVTFAYAEAGRFVPIGKIVQKIAADEKLVHAEVGRFVLRNELSTTVGRASYERIKHKVAAVVKEIGDTEMRFARDYLFPNGKELVGCNADLLCSFAQYCLTDVYNELPGIDNPFGNLTKNPIGYMDDWINLDNNQPAPQEEKAMNYLLGGFVSTANGKIYDTAGLC